jgi:NADH-quinone oxidoreductase subunit M
VYTLIFFQRPFHGPIAKGWSFRDLTGREIVILSSLVICLLWLGLYPKAAIDTANPALAKLQEQAARVERVEMAKEGGAPAAAVPTEMAAKTP